MTDFLIHILTASLWCFGVYAVFENDHILGKFGDWLQNSIGIDAIRPLFGCPPCMASVHGTLYTIVLWCTTGNNIIPGIWWSFIPFCVCLCGLNYIIKNIIFE